MDLDKLKHSWGTLDKQAQNHRTLQTENLKKVMKTKYHNRLRRILIPEVFGLVVCLYFAVLIIAHFSALKTLFLQTVGAITAVKLILFPSVRLWFFQKLYQANDLSQTPRHIYERFLKARKGFEYLQAINSGLGFLLLIAVLVLCSKIYNEYDAMTDKYFWATVFFLGFSFVLFFEYRMRKFYTRMINQAETIIKELE